MLGRNVRLPANIDASQENNKSHTEIMKKGLAAHRGRASWSPARRFCHGRSRSAEDLSPVKDATTRRVPGPTTVSTVEKQAIKWKEGRSSSKAFVKRSEE